MIIAWCARVIVFVHEAVAYVIAYVVVVELHHGTQRWEAHPCSKTGSPVMGCTKPSGRMPSINRNLRIPPRCQSGKAAKAGGLGGSHVAIILTLHLLVGTAGSWEGTTTRGTPRGGTVSSIDVDLIGLVCDRWDVKVEVFSKKFEQNNLMRVHPQWLNHQVITTTYVSYICGVICNLGKKLRSHTHQNSSQIKILRSTINSMGLFVHPNYHIYHLLLY